MTGEPTVAARGPGAGRINRHRCKAPGCAAVIPPARLMCRPHWYAVPKALRDRIWATWRSGAGVFDPAYRQAVREAVAALAGKRDGAR